MSSALWTVHSLKNFVEAHVSDYESPLDALYEYTKNLEEVPSKNIHIELLPDRRTILVYGDGKGLDATQLDEIRTGIGKSSKGVSHHGLGILAFMRFARKMMVFSKKDGVLYVLSCRGDNDEIVSDIGDAREVTSEEREYLEFYRKLNKFDGDGTITVIEGVGQYKSDRFDFTFDMKQEFEHKKLIKFFQTKASFSLMYHNYFLKKDEHSKAEKIKPKIGHGTKIEFMLPSPEYPVSDLPGHNKNVFKHNDRYFELKIHFVFHVSHSNDGEIHISENHQNALPIRDAIKVSKISGDSVYKNPDYTKYLTGSIDFKIKPLDGGEGINIYSGSRSALILDGEFGACLCNMLIHADIEIIRPKLNKFLNSSKDRKYDRRSNDLEKDMQVFFRDMRAVFDDIIVTKNQGPVQASMVKCPRCGLCVVPKRGGSNRSVVKEKNNIYAPDDVGYYVCGNCTKTWPRRSYEKHEEGNKKPASPIYKTPEPGESFTRKRLRGHGYRFMVCPLDRADMRRAVVFNDLVKINRDHPNYREIEDSKDHRNTLWFYERQMALAAIVRHELSDASKDEFATKQEEALSSLFVWFQTKRERVSAEKVEQMIEEEVKKESAKGAAEMIGKSWGAKVSI